MGKNKREQFREWNEKRKDRKDAALMQKADEAVYKLKLKFMQEDNLTWDEVCAKCTDDPEYAYWCKYQYHFVFMVKDPTHMKRYRDEFLDSLTPDEMEYHHKKGKDASAEAEILMAKKQAEMKGDGR